MLRGLLSSVISGAGEEDGWAGFNMATQGPCISPLLPLVLLGLYLDPLKYPENVCNCQLGRKEGESRDRKRRGGKGRRRDTKEKGMKGQWEGEKEMEGKMKGKT